MEHNLISYKSFKDKITLKDLYDCFIYYYAYLEECREAMLTNTTITLLVSRIPKSFLLQYGSALQEIAKGIFEIRNTIIHLRIINIEKAELRGEDGAFLSVFYKDKARIVKERKSTKGNQKGVDIFRELVNSRLQYFEGMRPMGAVADVTEIVMPKLSGS